MAITINGQLLLTMLAEKLVNNLNNITILQINTDGISIRFKRSDYENFKSLCKDWEKLTKLNLEYVEYSKMIIADVNSYIAVKINGEVKNKGRFEIDKIVGSEPAYHKDNSFRIIPLALQEYFVNNVPIKTTILNHFTNNYHNNNNYGIYDFCGRQKFKGADYGETHSIQYENGLPYKLIEKQQKNVRYYISKPGKTFIKIYGKENKKVKSEFINKGYQVTIFNKFEEKDFNEYNINYDFYIEECSKEINNIINRQYEWINI